VLPQDQAQEAASNEESPRVPGLALILLLALPAVALNPWSDDTFDLPKAVAVQLLIVGVLFAACLGSRRSCWSIRLTPVSLPLLILLGLASFSALRSIDPLYSLMQVAHGALLVILFHLLVSPNRAEERFLLVARTMALLGGVAALYGLLQLVGLDVVHTLDRFVPYSFFGNRNFAAEFIVLVLPPALALVLLASTRWTLVLWSAVSLLLVLHLAATQTRAGLIGLTLGLLGTALFWRYCRRIPQSPERWRRRGLLIVLILAIGYAFFLFPQPFKALQPVTAGVLGSERWEVAKVQEMATGAFPGKTLLSRGMLQSRFFLWRAGLQVIRDYPWSGVGPGNLEILYPLRYEPVEYWWPRSTWLPESFLHNEYLQIPAEIGIPGFLSFLGAIAALGWSLYRAASRPRPWTHQVLLAASLWSLIAIGADSFFSFPFHLPAQRLYAVVHLAAVAALAAGGTQRNIRVPKAVGIGIGVIFLALVVAGPIRLQIAELYVRKSWIAAGQGRRAQALAAHERAATWFPPLIVRDRLRKWARDPQPQYEKAAKLFEEELGRSPQDPQARVNLGLALLGAGRLEEANASFTRVLEQVPRHPQALRGLMDVALLRKRPEEALRYYEDLVSNGRCDGLLLFNLGVGFYITGEPQKAGSLWQQAIACDPLLRGMPERWFLRFAR